MNPREWAFQAFDACEHAGMICLNCAEQAIRAAIEEERARWCNGSHEQNGDQELPLEVPSSFTFSA